MLLIAETEILRLIDITGAKYFSFFALGMCLYLIHKHGSKIELWLLFAFNAAIGIHNTLYFSVPNEPTDGRFVTDVGVAIVVVAIIVLMTVLTLTPLKHRGYTWMTKAGALTYPLYLTHHYWGLWLIGLARAHHGQVADLSDCRSCQPDRCLRDRTMDRAPGTPAYAAHASKSFELGMRQHTRSHFSIDVA